MLGVKENSKDGSLYVEGLDDVHKLLKDFWNMVNNRQKVSCNILTDSMAVSDKLEGKDVIVIRVPRAERTSRPVYVGSDPRTGTYRRNFEGDYHCSIDEVSLMIRDSALVTDDNKLLTDLDVSVFCPDTVKSIAIYFNLSVRTICGTKRMMRCSCVVSVPCARIRIPESFIPLWQDFLCLATNMR